MAQNIISKHKVIHNTLCISLYSNNIFQTRVKTIKVVNDVDFSHTVYLISITFENKIPILQLTDLTSVNFSVTISKHLALTHDFVQITCIDTHFCLKEEYFFLSTFRNIKY